MPSSSPRPDHAPGIDPRLRAWVEIDLGALERNLANIRGALPPHIRYVAVVKADAYGHGLGPVATRFMHAGADLFAVANLHEADTLRRLGRGWPILVLSALLPAEAEAALEADVIPTLSSPEEAQRFGELARRKGRTLDVHLKIDTGMGRLGIWHEAMMDLADAVRAEPALRVAGLFTHFASAGEDAAFTHVQRERFLNALKVLSLMGYAHRKDLLIHADNSAGIETLAPESPFNAVRVGLLQFGIRPSAGTLLSQVAVEPVLSFHSRLGLVKRLPAGTALSYGQTRRLERATTVGIATAGYADGIPTSLSNRGEALVRGMRCPILGRVTMDQTILDLNAVPDAQPGERVTLIGQQGEEGIDPRGFAEAAGQIPWEVLVSITGRVKRVYRTDTRL